MQTSRKNTSHFLLLVYLISIAFSALPTLAMAGVEVTKVCPNKKVQKIKVETTKVSNINFQLMASHEQQDSDDEPQLLELCAPVACCLPPNVEATHPEFEIPPLITSYESFYSSPLLYLLTAPPRA